MNTIHESLIKPENQTFKIKTIFLGDSAARRRIIKFSVIRIDKRHFNNELSLEIMEKMEDI